ncbi:MAG TPA: ABC transporter transmembrane domain-containing protein [Terriglobia bacterium]|nr:ABC transporter transmembrane domain-containing protein [Terriglobia bacterium]
MNKGKRLVGLIRPYIPRFIFAIFLMAIVGACAGVFALLIKPVVDKVLTPLHPAAPIILFKFHGFVLNLQDLVPSAVQSPWAMVAFAIVAVTFVKGVSLYFATYSVNYIGQSVVRDLRDALYKRIIAQSMAFFSENPTGMLMSTVMSDIERIQDAVSHVLANFLKQAFTLLGLLIVIFYLDWRLALASLILVPFVVFPSAKIGRYIRASSRKSQDRMADITHILHETFSGIRIVKAFGMEQFEAGKFMAATRRLLRVNLRWVRAHALTSPLMELLGAITIALFLLYARNEIVHHARTLGGFVAFLVALIQMYEPIKRLAGVNDTFQLAVGASERVFAVLDVHSEVVEKPRAIALPPFRKEIVFDGVDFSYTDAPILQGVDLRIRKGEAVAIVGSSGAGKTTLANLIPRFFDVTRGRILFDGHDLRDVTVRSLRAQIGMVTQETVLFNDTVFNNIAYGQNLQDAGTVEEAARVALAHDFIMEMSEGYQTMIGERGQRLSGGQRQRIAIARALLKNSPILILDEATSALDTESEMLVQRALANLMAGRTVLVIAHRLSTVRRADRIIVLDRGAVSEIGTHEDLVTRGGIYQRLHDLQYVDVE